MSSVSMELDIQAEVVSTETVKPSSPTPSTLGTWKLSLLDQLSPPVHIPTILYYATSVTLGNPHSLLPPCWKDQRSLKLRTRFVFDAAAISALKAKARSQLVPKPSAVVAVLSFIWKCAMAASGKPTKQSVLACAVNLRPRMVPPLSVYCVGNMAWQAMATSMLSDEDEREKQLSNLVCMLTAAIAKVDRDHAQGLQGVTRFRKVSSFWEEMERTYSSESLEGPVTTYVASSWCKLGFNEVDFGWGKPLWVSHSGGKFLPLVPNIILMDSGRGGDQIEAWVALGEHEMHILEHDAEFTSFATLNPSIIA
ncbi:hypothetical protein RJ639_023339 [Escallonia herrerae]|uniref:BAHD acyltransferase n=1 Tax=Escallonia herrerae TaxID=1293975 RepID=A0AA88UZ49_9ASTE|nr:hypothetical protein RJ639_023339 [Escallonia herrerae]